jgi:phosphoglycolate phosphatase
MTVFLDLDGPVINCAERNYQVHRTLVEEMGGFMTLDRASLWKLKRGGRSSVELLKLTSGPTVEADKFKLRWLAEIEAPRWLELDTLHPGALSTLELLAERFRIVLVTLRQQRSHLVAQLGQLGFTRLFPTVLSDSPAAGPGWETKRRLIAQSGFKPFGVMVGDTEADIRAGKLVGLGTIGITCGIRDEAQLRKENPDVIADTLTNLQRLDLISLAKGPTNT